MPYEKQENDSGMGKQRDGVWDWMKWIAKVITSYYMSNKARFIEKYPFTVHFSRPFVLSNWRFQEFISTVEGN